MDYTFPASAELLSKVHKVWPEIGYKMLGELLVAQAGVTVSAEGLVAVLCFAVEDAAALTGKSQEFRAAAYATMPAVIRILTESRDVEAVALNEYLQVLARFRLMNAEPQ